ncbi:MAG: hypothetical protein GY811_01475 [Myxococcales bacterium]|nr:hypothetical protein [Myxococcales bacterium]
MHSSIASGKSFGLTVARTLYELGKNPSLRCAIVSNTAHQARKFLGVIANYIKFSHELKEVFPHLLPDQPWGADAITIQRPTVSKDHSIQAIGAHGNILGARLDLIVLDDILDYENCRTEMQRQTTFEWFKSTMLGRLTANGRVLVLGTAHHPDDLMHRLAAEQGWHHERFAIEDENGQPSWPQRWTKERIAEKRVELGPLEAARQLDCLARSDLDARFKSEWIDLALHRGQGKSLRPYLLNLNAPYRTITGVDLAVSKKSGADLTAFVTILVHPNGSRELLWVEAGRWSGPEIVDRIIDTQHKFLSTIVVESNAAQMYISQMVRQRANIPVISYTTGRGKLSLEWQCEALATELAAGRWILASDEQGRPAGEVASLQRDLLYYSPKSHCPDRLAALCFARWGAEFGDQRAGSVDFDLGWR